MYHDRCKPIDSFAVRLQFMRIRRGFTQSELASRVGVSCNAISDYENCRYFPRFEIIVALSRELDCGINYLMGVPS